MLVSLQYIFVRPITIWNKYEQYQELIIRRNDFFDARKAGK